MVWGYLRGFCGLCGSGGGIGVDKVGGKVDGKVREGW